MVTNTNREKDKTYTIGENTVLKVRENISHVLSHFIVKGKSYEIYKNSQLNLSKWQLKKKRDVDKNNILKKENIYLTNEKYKKIQTRLLN
jgi:hypothetical protein